MTPLLSQIVTGPSGGISTTTLLVGALNAVWGLLLAVGIVLRKRYEAEIDDLKARIGKYEGQSERSLQALEQAVAIAARQNETINKVVDKQGETLETITDRLEEIKSTATRRARPTP
jgi:hypothetical protein